MPFYGDVDDYCPPRLGRPALRRIAACALCVVVLGFAVIL